MLGPVSNCCQAGQVVTIEMTRIQYCTVQDLNQRTISAIADMNKTLSGHL